MTSEPEKPRLALFDTAVGITMILVVFGHNYFEAFQNDAVYAPLRAFIYQFHMAVFMFLSGFLIFYAYREVKTGQDYKRYVFRKIKKFVPIYVALSLFYMVAELALNKIGPAQIPEEIYHMLFSPVKSSATFLWYVYVLLIFYALTPMLKSLPFRQLCLVAAAGFLLTFIKLPHDFSAYMVGKYFFFFVTGGVMAIKMGPFMRVLARHGVYFIIAFAMIAVLTLSDIRHIPYQLTSAAAIGGILYISSLPIVERISLLQLIGRHSYYIYLFNTLVMGAFYILYQKSLLHLLIPGRFYILILTALGTLLPLAFSMFISRRSRTIIM
jgi:fucose 4-O-acetylase-like acetyltransferase